MHPNVDITVLIFKPLCFFVTTSLRNRASQTVHGTNRAVATLLKFFMTWIVYRVRKWLQHTSPQSGRIFLFVLLFLLEKTPSIFLKRLQLLFTPLKQRRVRTRRANTTSVTAIPPSLKLTLAEITFSMLWTSARMFWIVSNFECCACVSSLNERQVKFTS